MRQFDLSHAYWLAKRALKNPSKVPPWLAARASDCGSAIPCESQTWLRSHQHDSQHARLDDLRAGDDDNWLLVVLDACRNDVFADIVGPLLEGSVEPVQSAAHDTFEWLQTVWDGDHAMPYVSGAVPVNSEELRFTDAKMEHLYGGYQPTNHLHHIEDVWRDGWEQRIGCCPPAPVTDRALNVASDQTVVHYQQPHSPYIGDPPLLGHTDSASAHPGRGAPVDEPIWERAKSGAITDRELRAAYRGNVEVVAGEVCRLIDAMGAAYDRVVITADHGEALGEYGVYAHPRWPSHPHVRTVPWMEVQGLTAAGEKRAAEARSAGVNPRGRGGETGIENDELDLSDRLAALGYR